MSLPNPTRRWLRHRVAHERHFAALGDLPRLLAQILHNRGVRQPQDVAAFLDPPASRPDPRTLPDMESALGRLEQARSRGETVAVYGDYDADGLAATALLVEGLEALGFRAIPYIPDRFSEGYGLNQQALAHLRGTGVTLVVTVDCGVSAVAEIAWANERGLDIIVTDHHDPPPAGALPKALALINPRLPTSRYPFADLSGAGVALKLLDAITHHLGEPWREDDFLDLVAIGTITDVAPLVGENRQLVAQGLRRLATTQRPGLRALLDAVVGGQAFMPGATAIDSEDVSFVIGPRLNATGRLEHAISSYRLLITRDEAEAQSLAAELERKNTERRELTATTLEEARQQVGGQTLMSASTRGGRLESALPMLLLAQADHFPPGVLGLVAGRLAEEYHRPAFAVQTGNEECLGSARSIPEFNCVAALRACDDLLSRYGGHPRAAGFALPRDNWEAFCARLNSLASEQLAGLDLRPSVHIDARLDLSRPREDVLEILERLRPFGHANPSPLFLAQNLEVVGHRILGGGEHLEVRLAEGGQVWRAIGFGLAPGMTGMSPVLPPRLDAVFHLESRYWQGKRSVELRLADWAPAGERPILVQD